MSATKSAMVTSTSWPTPTPWDAAGRDGARHALVVEAPEILERAAAARDDHTSHSLRREAVSMARTISGTAAAPCTAVGYSSTGAAGNARAALSICRVWRRPWAS
jgi:hypothetical protein